MKTAFILLTLLLVGCVRYEYDITRPAELTRHIGGKADTVLGRDPLEYRLRTVDNRLVMRIYNPTNDTINLIGPRSSAVDPDGQSHPLRSQPMAPHSYIKLILPPRPPTIQRTGPSIGIGFGTTIGDSRFRRHGMADYGYSEPRYYAIQDEDSLYWDWEGATDIRLTLVFDRGGKMFEHEFVIARKKM